MKMTKIEAYMGIGAVVIIAAALGYLYLYEGGSMRGGVNDRASVSVDVDVPPMTDVMQEVLQKSKGFQHLISYTDRGFEPASAQMRAGETVRFSNNSSKELWVSAAAVKGGGVYPGGSGSCGQSDFDTCIRLQPKEFWEFTLERDGTWGFINTAHPADEGVLTVI